MILISYRVRVHAFVCVCGRAGLRAQCAQFLSADSGRTHRSRFKGKVVLWEGGSENTTRHADHIKMAAITLSRLQMTTTLILFLDDSLHLNTKIISRICSFQNYIYLKKPKTS